MPAAKQHHKAPLVIAQDVVDRLQDGSVFAAAEAVKPGFINLRVAACISGRPSGADAPERAPRVTGERKPRGVVLDYGGPNVAKPLHIGHLRSAIIGESIKRIYRYFGDNVVGDIHLATGACRSPDHRRAGAPQSRTCPILTRASPARIPRKRRSRSPSWRRSTPRPAPARRRTSPSPPALTRSRLPCSSAVPATMPCGATSCRSPWPICVRTMTI